MKTERTVYRRLPQDRAPLLGQGSKFFYTYAALLLFGTVASALIEYIDFEIRGPVVISGWCICASFPAFLSICFGLLPLSFESRLTLYTLLLTLYVLVFFAVNLLLNEMPLLYSLNMIPIYCVALTTPFLLFKHIAGWRIHFEGALISEVKNHPTQLTVQGMLIFTACVGLSMGLITVNRSGTGLIDVELTSAVVAACLMLLVAPLVWGFLQSKRTIGIMLISIIVVVVSGANVLPAIGAIHPAYAFYGSIGIFSFLVAIALPLIGIRESGGRLITKATPLPDSPEVDTKKR